jgi:segregation and condensation protein A
MSEGKRIDGEATGEELSPQSSVLGPRPSAYRVRLDLFEGPLDLLLHLIKKNEVDITDIPIATITEQYLAYLDLMRDLSLDVAGEYLVMAATLMLIKSRMLLPSPEADEEEEGPDPRAGLVRQLLEYQRYREAAEELRSRALLGRDVFTREPGTVGFEIEEDVAPNVRATLWDLLEAFRAALERAKPDPVHEVEIEPVSLRDRVRSLLGTLGIARSVTFDSLFDENATRHFVIVTFLALLELMKIGAVDAVQEERFGSIMIVLAVEDASRVSLDLADEYAGATVTEERRDE